jgi:hypothetical protein
MPAKVGIHAIAQKKKRRGWFACADHDGRGDRAYRSTLTADGTTFSLWLCPKPVRSGDRSSAPADKIHDQDDQEDDNEHVEQDLSDAGGSARDTTETKQAGDKSYDKSHKRIV